MRKKRVCKKKRKVKKLYEKRKKLPTRYGRGIHVYGFVEKNKYVSK